MTGFNTSYSLIPPVVKTLLIANGAVFLLELSLGDAFIVWLGLWPMDLSGASSSFVATPHFQPWQLVTYSFLHGGAMHLLLNMYALWLFGARMENLWGSRTFAGYYFFCVIEAGAVQLVVASMAAEVYPTIGASGGVFGLLLAFGLTFPEHVGLADWAHQRRRLIETGQQHRPRVTGGRSPYRLRGMLCAVLLGSRCVVVQCMRGRAHRVVG